MKVFVRCFAVLRCLLSSCDHCPGWFGPGCSLYGAMGHHQYPTLFPRFHHCCYPAVVVVATTPIIFPAFSTLAATTFRVTTSAVAIPPIAAATAPLFGEASFFQRLFRGWLEY